MNKGNSFLTAIMEGQPAAVLSVLKSYGLEGDPTPEKVVAATHLHGEKFMRDLYNKLTSSTVSRSLIVKPTSNYQPWGSDTSYLDNIMDNYDSTAVDDGGGNSGSGLSGWEKFKSIFSDILQFGGDSAAYVKDTYDYLNQPPVNTRSAMPVNVGVIAGVVVVVVLLFLVLKPGG